MKIIIIEDEPAAANQLKFLLKQINIPHEILKTIETVEEGIEWFSMNESPDLVFSDIQLADGISFEIYEKVEVKSPIIFTTAFDEFAIRAFKLNSIDYLLKPIDTASLQFAIDKFNNQQLLQEEKLQALIQKQVFSQKTYRKSFLVRYRDKLLPIKSEEFAYFFIENGLVYGQTFDKRKLILDFTLDEIETQLDPIVFTRANRQYIVSRECISELESYNNSRLLVKTIPVSNSDIVISKEKVTIFKKWFENGTLKK